MILVAMMMAVSSHAMSFAEAQRHALYLSDKMANQLGLTDRQYDEVYQVNLDYLLAVDRSDVYGNWWRRRNAELRSILTSVQFAEYMRISHFYRPVSWRNNAWHYGVYGHYRDRGLMYRGRPSVYSNYRGGRYFGPAPAPGPRPGHVAPGPRPGRVAPGPRPNPNRATPGPRPNPNRVAPAPGPRPNGLRQDARPRDNRPQPRVTPQNPQRPSYSRERDNRDRRDRAYDRRNDRRNDRR